MDFNWKHFAATGAAVVIVILVAVLSTVTWSDEATANEKAVKGIAAVGDIAKEYVNQLYEEDQVNKNNVRSVATPKTTTARAEMLNTASAITLKTSASTTLKTTTTSTTMQARPVTSNGSTAANTTVASTKQSAQEDNSSSRPLIALRNQG